MTSQVDEQPRLEQRMSLEDVPLDRGYGSGGPQETMAMTYTAPSPAADKTYDELELRGGENCCSYWITKLHWCE